MTVKTLKATELLNITMAPDGRCMMYSPGVTGTLLQGCHKKEIISYHESDRYPGWVFRKVVTESWLYEINIETGIDQAAPRPSTENWFATKLGVSHAIDIWKLADGSYAGELCTRRMDQGGLHWERISEYRSPFYGSVKGCVVEAERRTAYWQAKESVDIHGDRLKLKMPDR